MDKNEEEEFNGPTSQATSVLPAELTVDITRYLRMFGLFNNSIGAYRTGHRKRSLIGLIVLFICVLALVRDILIITVTNTDVKQWLGLTGHQGKNYGTIAATMWAFYALLVVQMYYFGSANTQMTWMYPFQVRAYFSYVT